MGFEFPAKKVQFFFREIKGEVETSPLVPKSPMLLHEKVPKSQRTPTQEQKKQCAMDGKMLI